MTIYPSFTLDSDLVRYPGAPYPDSVILAAEASLRGECFWHIAPEVREALTVEATHPQLLKVPTMRVVAVYTIVDQFGTPVVTYTANPGGVIQGAWIVGRRYTVDLTHGHRYVPDLAPIVAARCQRYLADALVTQRSETVGQRTSSESYNVDRLKSEADSDLLKRYMLRRRR